MISPFELERPVEYCSPVASRYSHYHLYLILRAVILFLTKGFLQHQYSLKEEHLGVLSTSLGEAASASFMTRSMELDGGSWRHMKTGRPTTGRPDNEMVFPVPRHSFTCVRRGQGSPHVRVSPIPRRDERFLDRSW